MQTKYRFTINDRIVYPVYDDKLSKDYTKYADEQFLRPELSGKIKLIGSDFDWLHSSDYSTEFELIVEISHNYVDYEEYWRGTFTKNKCRFIVHDRVAEIKLKIKDQYTDILDGLNNEFNFVELTQTKHLIEIQKRPLLQVYIPGSRTVNCILGGTHWEQSVFEEVTDDKLLTDKYFFKLSSQLNKVNISDGGEYGEFSGDYLSKGPFLNYKSTYADNAKNTYRINYVRSLHTFLFRLIRLSDSTVMYESNTFHYSQSPTDTEYVLNAVGGGATGTLTLFWFDIKIYMRYLVDKPSFNLLAYNVYAHEIPHDDFINDNRNYRRAVGFVSNTVTYSSITQVEPTIYGLSDNGEYFVKPQNKVNSKYIPIAKSTWTQSSLWLDYVNINSAYEYNGRKPIILRDSSEIGTLIKSMLSTIAPNIIFDTTIEHSEFLYSHVNPITGAEFNLFITPKTNITAGEYDRPAQRAMLTLQHIFSLLKATCRCYWFIDEDNKLRIEHLSWFRRGGSYTGNNTVSIDITNENNRKNKKLYSFNTEEYDYDDSNTNSRYEFDWMDESTDVFHGFPIEILSNHVDKSNVKPITPGQFTSDVDYMLVNPSAISNDGFALLSPVINSVSQHFNESVPGYYNYLTGSFVQNSQYLSRKYDLLSLQPNELDDLYVSCNTNTSASSAVVYLDSSGTYIGYEYRGINIQVEHVRSKLTIPANTRFICVTSYGNKYGNVRYFAEYKLPFTTEYMNGDIFNIQNGYVSWMSLHRNFWPYDLPSRIAKINNSERNIKYTSLIKKSTIEIPLKDDINIYELVKTPIGLGTIDSCKINLSSRMHQIELRYEAE